MVVSTVFGVAVEPAHVVVLGIQVAEFGVALDVGAATDVGNGAGADIGGFVTVGPPISFRTLWPKTRGGGSLGGWMLGLALAPPDCDNQNGCEFALFGGNPLFGWFPLPPEPMVGRETGFTFQT